MNHKTADVALREKVAFDSASVRRALQELIEQWESTEAVILSTCNRTEIYAARPIHGHPREHELMQWLCEFCGVHAHLTDDALYALSDTDAVRHLLEVTAGLDSLVVGEPQIAGQVRDAYATAREETAARSIMNVLFQTALHAAKEVRSNTELTPGQSVAAVAVDCAGEPLGSLEGKSVLCVGAGQTAELILRSLTDSRVGQLVIANRSPGKAVELTRTFGGEGSGLDNLPELLSSADLVLTSTGSEDPLITRSMLKAARAHRSDPLVIVDIAVPRDVDPDVRTLTGVTLYDMDDLQRLIAERTHCEDLKSPSAAIISEHVESILKRVRIRDLAPTIDAMYRFMRGISEEELTAALNKLASHDDSEQDAQIFRRTLHRTIRRILHPMVHNLRRASGTDAAAAHAASLRRLFGLDGGKK
jgi:glutamyl-tRNA reductase